MLPYIFTDLIILMVVTITLWVWMWIVPVRVIKVKRLYMGARGLALPGFIFLTEGAWREDVLRHELAHQAQMRKYSPIGAALLLDWLPKVFAPIDWIQNVIVWLALLAIIV